eukprot:251466-Lingulodinium_polyedra.AAC.1
MAAASLSQGGLRERARLAYKLAKPLYDAHSTHAREARAPSDVLSYYPETAKGAYRTPLIQ